MRSISAIFNDKNDLLAVKTMEVHHGSVMDLWVEICHVENKEMMDLIILTNWKIYNGGVPISLLNITSHEKKET